MEFVQSFCELGSAFVDGQVASRTQADAAPEEEPPKLEHLYGCSACNYSEVGCKLCWESPFASRPAARARPGDGHRQDHLPAAPTFRPTAEQFSDPFAYLARIAPEASRAGIALIVPPEGWAPPIQMLDQETGQLRRDFRVPTRIQPTHLLCKRYATPSGAPPEMPASARVGVGADAKREQQQLQRQQQQLLLEKRQQQLEEQQGGRQQPEEQQQDQERQQPEEQQQQQQRPAVKEEPGAAAVKQGGAAAAPPKKSNAVAGRCSRSAMDHQKAALAAAEAAAAEAAEGGKDVILNPAHWDAVTTAAAASEGQFGYEHLEDPLSLYDFHRYADWAKRRHFNGPLMCGSRKAGAPAAVQPPPGSAPVDAASAAWRVFPCTPEARAGRGVHGKWLPGSEPPGAPPPGEWREPSLEEVEAEFWRIVEAADEQVEALYGQDIDTATYNSAFPTIKELARAEARHVLAGAGGPPPAAAPALPPGAGPQDDPDDPALAFPACRCGGCQLCRLRAYTSHPWNINNIPQAAGSVLRFVREDVGGKPITGLMVPWVYVGSCFSAFCWHIEDHGLYSVNYNHMGAPKVWYGVPATAAAALDAAMRDALPHLFAKDKLLLHKLVTMLSPGQLTARGVPVCRAVQVPGSFIVTFPDAYHAGFNSGFNVAEAVNFAAPDWLPFGSSSVVRYRCESRYMTFSHDAMLINVVRGATAAAAAALPAPAGGGGGGRQQEEDAAGSGALLPGRLRPQRPRGLRAQLAAAAEAIAAQAEAEEAAAAERGWRERQQQQQQQQQGSELVRLVAPGCCGSDSCAAKMPAVAFATSAAESFWWQAPPEATWAEVAAIADEADAAHAAHAALLAARRAREQEASPTGEQQQQQQHQHHDSLHATTAAQHASEEHHLSAASHQHHAQGQRERVFTMRGAAAGPAAISMRGAAQGLPTICGVGCAPSPADMAAAARALADTSFCRPKPPRARHLPPRSSAAAVAAAAAASAAAAAADSKAKQAAAALTRYVLAAAEARRQRMLVQPPGAELARLAVGELALRLELEQQRQTALMLRAGVTRTALMSAGVSGVDPATGVHANTQGVECAECGCDLSLAAVVSDGDPGRAVCPEHVSELDGTPSQCRLLLRYSPGALAALLAAAVKLVPGAERCVAAARARQSWVAAGRFIGGTVLQRPAGGCAGDGQPQLPPPQQQEQEQQQEQQRHATAEPAVQQQQQQSLGQLQDRAGSPAPPLQALQREAQPVVEVRLLGRLYDPDEIDPKLFEDLDDGEDDEGDEDDEAARGAGAEQEAAQGQAAKAAARDGSHSGGDHSSGSWWEDELGGHEDAFGFYTFAALDEDTSDEDFDGGDGGDGSDSDGDFRPAARGARGASAGRKRRAAPPASAARKRGRAAAAAPVAGEV